MIDTAAIDVPAGLCGVATVNSVATAFRYDAAESSKRRAAPSAAVTSEDAQLTPKKRDTLTSGARDVARNFALIAHAIRKHLDYVVEHDLHCRTGNAAFDLEFEAKVAEWVAADLFDLAGRHDLQSWLRIMEARAVVDGDLGNVFLGSGHTQAIESDRIRNPDASKSGEWTHGVRSDLSRPGRAKSYFVRNRNANGKGWAPGGREIAAENFHLHAYFDRFDQVRGIAPIVSGLNHFRDLYEGFDYGLAKLKVEQLFCLAIYRNAAGALEGLAGDGEHTPYRVDLHNGPAILDMDPGDKAEFLKSDSPGANTRQFLEAVGLIALKALDIPWSFIDESFTNFYGSVGAWRHYDRSCRSKRRNVRKFLQWWLKKRVQLAVIRGELRLPSGLTLVRPWWEWVPSGMPWWDPSKEINADLQAVMAGWGSPQQICKQRGGGDWYRNVDETARAIEYAKEAGVPLSFAPVQTAAVDPIDEAERTAKP